MRKLLTRLIRLTLQSPAECPTVTAHLGGGDVIRMVGTRFLDSLTRAQQKVLNAIVRAAQPLCGRASRSMRSLWVSGDQIPFMPESALPKVPGQRTREVAPKNGARSCCGRYFHIVFSVPHQLIPLIGKTRNSCSRCCSKLPAPRFWKWPPIPNVSAPKSAFLCILHTWGRTLNRHPHIHCCGAAGLSPITLAGYRRILVSSCRSRSSAVSS